MATKEKEQKSAAGGGGGGGKGGKAGGDAKGKGKGKKGGEGKARGHHAGAKLPVPPPRLKEFYQTTVRAKLSQQFDLKNPHEIPGLEKIVLNVGVGEAIKQPK